MFMNKKMIKLKQKGFINIISFFIEFFLLSSIFKSSLMDGNLYYLLIKIFPITKEVLISSSLSLIVLSTSLRCVYMNYLNKKIDILENKDEIINRLQRKFNEEDEEVCNKYVCNNDLDYCYSDTDKNKKTFVKVYKK